MLPKGISAVVVEYSMKVQLYRQLSELCQREEQVKNRNIILALALAATVSGAAFAENAGQPLEGLPAVIGMNNKALGGACSVSGLNIWDYISYKIPGDGTEWNWTKAGGCPNLDVLVKTWGTVKNTFYSPTTGARWFHVDDGSHVTSDLADSGILVYSDADVKIGQFVAVTGISGTEPAIDMPDKLIRVLRTRTADDVQVLKEPAVLYPSSDEFDDEKLDWWWYSYPYYLPTSSTGSISLESGWLKLSIPSMSCNDAVRGPFVTQTGASGNWNLEAKLRLSASPDPARQGIVVAMESWGSMWNGPADVASDPSVDYLAAVYTTSQTSLDPVHVLVAGKSDYCSGVSDTWYFSVRKRGNTLYGSVSPDGVSFSDEVASVCGEHRYFDVYTYSCPVGNVVRPVSGYVDYIHITPVSE